MIERDTDYELIYGDAMLSEMEKIGGIGSALSSVNKARIGGSLIGAGLGGVAGAKTNKDDPASGALAGALYGGLAGLGAGQLATRAGRSQAARFGKRQLHGMTGYVPRTASQKSRGVSMFGKGLSKGERVQALKDIGLNVGSKSKPKNLAVQDAMSRQHISKKFSPKVRQRLAELEVASQRANREAAEEGLTSIPGVLKGMATKPVSTVRKGFVSQGPAGMALGLVPAAAAIPGAVSGEGFGQEYHGQAGKLIGENLGYAALGAAPIAPMIIGGLLAGKAGELVHKGGKAAVKGVKNEGRTVQPRYTPAPRYYYPRHRY